MSSAQFAIALSSLKATAQTGTLTFHFTRLLDATSVGELARYRVTVEGEVASVLAAQLSGGDTLTLALPPGVLVHGSQVNVSWWGVLDRYCLPLTGEGVTLLHQ